MRKQIPTLQWIMISSVLFTLLSACASNIPLHATYTYNNFSCPPNVRKGNEFATLSLHTGHQLRIEWQPLSGPPTPESAPTPVSLTAELIGPFPSLNAAQQVSHRDAFNISSPSVASISPIQTNDWANKAYVSIMELPPRLIPAYYIEIERAESTNTQGTTRLAGACILKITL